MRSHRRALALLLSVTTVLSSWTIPVHADETFDYDAAYSAIVNTGAGAYMLQCQPDTALHLAYSNDLFHFQKAQSCLILQGVLP